MTTTANEAGAEPGTDAVTTSGLDRRRVLLTGAVVVAGAAVTAACGSSSAATSSGAAADGGSPTGASGAIDVKTSDVPVGGGVVLADQKVVVTQPTAGTYKAFSA